MSPFQRLTLTIRGVFIGILTLPVLAGLVGVVMPALGYFPALNANDVSGQVFERLFALNGIGTMVGLSLGTGLVATIISFVGAMVLLAAFYRSAYLQRIQSLLSPLLVLPHAAAAIALLFVLSPSGLVARLFMSWTQENENQAVLPPLWPFPYDSYGISIIIALALKELPFIFLMAMSVLSQPQLKQKLEGYYSSATALGYSPVTVFYKTILPFLYPYIRLPVLAVLAYATANVEIPLILGANNPPTLAVAIVQWFNHVDLSMRFQASAAALLQVGVTLTAIAMWLLLEYCVKQYSALYYHKAKRRTWERVTKLCAYGGVGLYVMLGVFIIVSVVIGSLATYWPFPQLLPDGFTLLHWKTALSALSMPIVNTLQLAVVVSAVSVAIAMLALEAEWVISQKYSRKRWVMYSDKLLLMTLFLPLLVPGVAFLYGLVWFQLVYLKDSMWFHLLLSHLVYVLPYVFISLAVAYRRFDARYVQVAYGLGKTPWQVFVQIKLPLLFAPVLVAFALGMAISFSQYLPTLLSTGGRVATVTTEAVAVASGSSVRLTAVYALIQAVLPLGGFFIAWWLPTVCFNPMKRHVFFSTRKLKV